MLYLAYHNQHLTDGAGAQLQRILSLFLISRVKGIGYLHLGLSKLGYMGAACLESNREDDTNQMKRYNDLFSLPSDPLDSKGISQIVPVVDYSDEVLAQVAAAVSQEDKNILLLSTFAGTYIDKNPWILRSHPLPLPWIPSSLPTIGPLQIAIHIRRGELFVVDSDRMLPNSYYVDCMRTLQRLLRSRKIPFEFHIHTEQLSKPIEVSPDHHGIWRRISSNVVVRPEDTHLEDFAEFKQVFWHVNEDPVETLKQLALSHVLLASRSSFSYVAAICKPRDGGLVYFHPFWHSLAEDWIPCRGPQDIEASQERLFALCKNRNGGLNPVA